MANVGIESSRWLKSPFTRMNFGKRRKSSSKVEIREKAQKRIEFLFLHHVASMVKEHHIPQGADPGLILRCCKILRKKLNIEMM